MMLANLASFAILPSTTRVEAEPKICDATRRERKQPVRGRVGDPTVDTKMTRCTLLLITSGPSGRKALSEGMLLAEQYVDGLPMDLEILESTPFALAPAVRIQERVSFPVPLEDPSAAATAVGPLQAIWNGKRWLTPGSCPPKPLRDNGATEWQWAHYKAVLDAPAESIMLLWDIYVVPMSEQLAA
jgi:hypothetical protein